MAQNLAEMKQRNAVVARNAPFPKLLEMSIGEIKRALPAHLKPERLSRIALTAFRRTPNLARCEPRSVLAAVIQAAQLGLEPDTLGRAYLVPYGKECQFIPGWKGLVELLHRSGQGHVHTGVIYRDQKYRFEDGSTRALTILNETNLWEPGDITHAFAVGRIKGSDDRIIELWPVARLEAHRDKYNKVGKRHYSFDNWEMYIRKVVLLQVLKYMPLSADLVRSVELDNAAAQGSQHLTVEGSIDGEWEPVPEEAAGDKAEESHADDGGAPVETGRGNGSPESTQVYQEAARQGQSDTKVEDPRKPWWETANAVTFVKKISEAETSVRMEEVVDLARSRKDFTAKEKEQIRDAAMDAMSRPAADVE